MATSPENGSLSTVFRIIGGFMQPHGHVQLLMNMLIFGMNPQQALDAPRECIGPMGHQHIDSAKERMVKVEEGVESVVVEELRRRGHTVEVVGGWNRELFGRGQIIRA
jgi:gamma-glutamyltranspeptidase/glutathione hydrolase